MFSLGAIYTCTTVHKKVTRKKGAKSKVQNDKNYNTKPLLQSSFIGFPLFTGVSGPVGIDEKGDRVASYRLQSFLSGMSGVRVANFFGTTGELQLLNQTIMWPGGTTEIPIGRPACGFDNEFCKVDAKGMTH